MQTSTLTSAESKPVRVERSTRKGLQDLATTPPGMTDTMAQSAGSAPSSYKQSADQGTGAILREPSPHHAASGLSRAPPPQGGKGRSSPRLRPSPLVGEGLAGTACLVRGRGPACGPSELSLFLRLCVSLASLRKILRLDSRSHRDFPRDEAREKQVPRLTKDAVLAP